MPTLPIDLTVHNIHIVHMYDARYARVPVSLSSVITY